MADGAVGAASGVMSGLNGIANGSPIDYGNLEQLAAMFPGGAQFSNGIGFGVNGQPVDNTTYGSYGTGATGASAARGAFNSGRQAVYDSVGSTTQNKGIEYNSGILDFLSSLKQGQQAVETAGAKNELARMTGQAGVLGMVGRGIKSSGVTLANRNAGDSSAAGALAGAYGELGQRQMANVGNQYALGDKDVQLQQQQLDEQRATGARKIDESKQMYINDIVASASDKFAALNADAANASLPDRIAIEQEKEAIRQQVIGELQKYDQTLQTGMQGVQAGNVDSRRTAAIGLRDAGTQLGADAFNFTDQAPLELQGGQAAGSILPIYTMPRGRRAA